MVMDRYAAPCGWGGSYKYYTFTLYALSGDLYKKYAKKQDVEDNVWGDPSVLGPDLVSQHTLPIRTIKN